MTRSMQHFGEDDEAASTLRDLGYSDEEIGRTAGSPAVAGMAAEDRLRLSLRALSAEHSAQTQAHAQERVSTPPNPKMFEKQEEPVGNSDEAYQRGRRDERYLRKNDPDYKKPPRQPRAARPRSPQSLAREQLRTVHKLSSLARQARGRRR